MSEFINKMEGRGLVIPVSVSGINLKTKLAFPGQSKIKAKASIIAKNSNNLFCEQVEIIKRVNPIKKIKASDDVYISSEYPYLSYHNYSMITHGTKGEIDYKSYMSFKDLQNIKPNIGDNILDCKIKLPIYGNTDLKEIVLRQITKPLDSYNTTYFNQPREGKIVAILKKVGNYFVGNVTDLVKDIYKGKETNYGYTFGPINDTVTLNSHINPLSVPTIEIEWYDSSILTSSMELRSKVNLLPHKSIKAKVDITIPFPIINAKCLLSKEDVRGKIKFSPSTVVSCKAIVVPPDQYSVMNAKVLFSQPIVKGSVLLAQESSINCKCQFKKDDKSSINTKVELIKLPSIKSKALLGYETTVNGKVNIKFAKATEIKTICLFSKDNIRCKCDLAPGLRETSILGKARLVKNDNSVIGCKCLFSQDLIKCKSTILFGEKINSKVLLGRTENIKCKALIKINGETTIKSKIDLAFPDVVAIPCKASINFGNSIYGKARLQVNTSTDIKGRVNLAFPGKTELPFKVGIVFENAVKGRMLLAQETGIKSKVDVVFSRANSITGKVLLGRTNTINSKVYLSPMKTIPCKVLFDDDTSFITIPCKTSILFDNKIKCRANVAFDTSIKCKSSIIFNNAIPCKARIVINDERSIRAKAHIIVKDKTTITCKVDLIKQMNVVVRIIEL